jgi:hypothetical protein
MRLASSNSGYEVHFLKINPLIARLSAVGLYFITGESAVWGLSSISPKTLFYDSELIPPPSTPPPPNPNLTSDTPHSPTQYSTVRLLQSSH